MSLEYRVYFNTHSTKASTIVPNFDSPNSTFSCGKIVIWLSLYTFSQVLFNEKQEFCLSWFPCHLSYSWPSSSPNCSLGTMIQDVVVCKIFVLLNRHWPSHTLNDLAEEKEEVGKIPHPNPGLWLHALMYYILTQVIMFQERQINHYALTTEFSLCS